MQHLKITNNSTSSIADTKSSSLFDNEMRKDFSFEDDRKDKATCYASNCSEDHYGSDNHSSASPNPKSTFIEDVKKFALAQ